MNENGEIIPTILTNDLEELRRRIERVRGFLRKVQVDIVEGRFVGQKSLEIEALAGVAEIKEMGVDLHLMVERPEDWVERCLEVFPELIIAQVEGAVKLPEFVEKVIESGTKVGIALDLETPVEAVPEEIYTQCDLVLVMSVLAGRSGQEFQPKVLEKIKKVKEMVGDLVDIGVDGGLNEKNISYCRQAGANVFYVGNSFWLAEDLERKYLELKEIIEKA